KLCDGLRRQCALLRRQYVLERRQNERQRRSHLMADVGNEPALDEIAFRQRLVRGAELPIQVVNLLRPLENLRLHSIGARPELYRQPLLLAPEIAQTHKFGDILDAVNNVLNLSRGIKYR